MRFKNYNFSEKVFVKLYKFLILPDQTLLKLTDTLSAWFSPKNKGKSNASFSKISCYQVARWWSVSKLSRLLYISRQYCTFSYHIGFFHSHKSWETYGIFARKYFYKIILMFLQGLWRQISSFLNCSTLGVNYRLLKIRRQYLS